MGSGIGGLGVISDGTGYARTVMTGGGMAGGGIAVVRISCGWALAASRYNACGGTDDRLGPVTAAELM